jgi:hypothetical protein
MTATDTGRRTVRSEVTSRWRSRLDSDKDVVWWNEDEGCWEDDDNDEGKE